jgi:hypothetical protein
MAAEFRAGLVRGVPATSPYAEVYAADCDVWAAKMDARAAELEALRSARAA